MTKSKKRIAGRFDPKTSAITCSHCDSNDVAYEGLVEVVSAAAGMRARHVERYTCFACRNTFDRPRGDLLRRLAEPVDFNPPPMVSTPNATPAEPEEPQAEAE